MAETEHIIIEDRLTGAGSGRLSGYLCHAYCYEGHCTFTFNGRPYRLEAGNCLIVRRGNLLEDILQSDDFRVDAVYVTPEFITLSTPQSNYGTIGSLALFNNPIISLTPEQQKVCALDFDYIKRRLALTTHHFHRDAMINAVQCMIIDFFDFHAQQARQQGQETVGKEPVGLPPRSEEAPQDRSRKVSTQYAQLMNQFIGLLEQGDYRRHRELGYYADNLCVTPKYLSEVSKKMSGFPANYWITRYASLDISRLLRDKGLSFARITELYGFSSVSYFSRYVQKNLGVSPSQLRE